MLVTTIERVTATELSELVPLMEAYCRFYETAPGPEALGALAEALLAAPDTEGVQLLARDESGRAIGFATMYWSWDTTEAVRTAIMHDLYVDETVRGGGVGRALIEACGAEAAARQAPARLADRAGQRPRAAALRLDGRRPFDVGLLRVAAVIPGLERPAPRFDRPGPTAMLSGLVGHRVAVPARRPGAVAQLVAHLHGMEGVRGSSPLSSTRHTSHPNPAISGLRWCDQRLVVARSAA